MNSQPEQVLMLLLLLLYFARDGIKRTVIFSVTVKPIYLYQITLAPFHMTSNSMRIIIEAHLEKTWFRVKDQV